LLKSQPNQALGRSGVAPGAGTAPKIAHFWMGTSVTSRLQCRIEHDIISS
jgi:hypothetical protein